MDISIIWKPLGLSLCLCATPLFAEEAYSCAGSAPDWEMEITGDSATFSFVAAEVMDIPQRSTAQDRDWPKALTLLGGRDTAIVILDQGSCSTDEITGYTIVTHILTQKSETPVILTGCCTQP